MKIIRAISIAFAVLLPAAAVASPTVRASCCPDGACCPIGCPFCPSGVHR